MGDGVKGSIGNPYSLSEFETLFNNGQWTGGFVQVGDYIVYYFQNGTTQNDDPDEEEGCGSGCGSGSGSGSGSENGCGCSSNSWNWYDTGDENIVDVVAGSTNCTMIDEDNLEFELNVSWTEGKYHKLSGACTSVASVIVNPSKVEGNENLNFEIISLNEQHYWLLSGGLLGISINYHYRKGNNPQVIESSVSGSVGCFTIPE